MEYSKFKTKYLGIIKSIDEKHKIEINSSNETIEELNETIRILEQDKIKEEQKNSK
jgi:hypothetical protein